MKHLILLLIVLVAVYFGWQYTPSRAKFFIKEFLSRHAGAVTLIWVSLWGALFFAAHNGSINIL